MDMKEKYLEKIWKDWEAFASYAFNKKSHSPVMLGLHIKPLI